MFVVNTEDNSIYVTRGDAGTLSVVAKLDGSESNYVFKPGDVVRLKVVQKKNYEKVALQKDVAITEETERVDFFLTGQDTKIGDVISKPVDYWYEVELNPFTNPQTIIGYDDEDGAKIFKLFPEGRDLVDDITEEDIPVVDTELSLTSERPLQNQAIARAVTNLNTNIETLKGKLAEEMQTRETQQNNVANSVKVLNARMSTFTALESGSTSGDAELTDIRVGANGRVYNSAGDSVRGQVSEINNSLVNQGSNTFGAIDMNTTTTDLGINTNEVTVWRFAKIGAPIGEYPLEKIFLKSPRNGIAHICIAAKTNDSFTVIEEFDINVVNGITEYINGIHFHSDTIIKEGYLIGCKIPSKEYVYMYYGGTEGSYTANSQTYTLGELSYGISIGAELKSSVVERINNIEKKTINRDNPLSDIYKVPTFITSFGRICCIGDSLTHGDMNTTNNGNIAMTQYSYPTIMARLTGCTVLNYGLSGYRAKKGDNSSWLQQAEKNNWLTNEDKCNLYIIALGTNDMAVGFSGDINTDINLEDYTQNANTSVGGYASIIQKIRSIQPRAKIFCVTIPISRDKQIPSPYNSSTRIVANSKIRNIASMFDCYVIDLERYGEYTPEDVTYFENVYKNATHNNALGYNLRARQYIAYIDWIIANNLEEFQDIQFIGTNLYLDE